MTLLTCMHPYATREQIGGMEVCGYCGETREADGGLWRSSVRIQMRVGDEWWTLTEDCRVVCIRKPL